MDISGAVEYANGQMVKVDIQWDNVAGALVEFEGIDFGEDQSVFRISRVACWAWCDIVAGKARRSVRHRIFVRSAQHAQPTLAVSQTMALIPTYTLNVDDPNPEFVWDVLDGDDAFQKAALAECGITLPTTIAEAVEILTGADWRRR